jgi:MFS family permease
MSGATLAPALPKIQAQFASVPASELWVMMLLAMPSLTTAIAGDPVGRWIDRFGRKPLLTAAVLLYGVAGCSGLILNDLPSLLAGRALLGIAVAVVTTTSAALIADYYIGETRRQILGYQSAFMGISGIFFVIFGGWVGTYSWRLPFAIYLIAFILLPLTWFVLPEPKRSQRQPKPGNLDAATSHSSGLQQSTLRLLYGLTGVTMLIYYMIPAQFSFYITQLNLGDSLSAGLAIAASTLASAIASVGYGLLKATMTFTKVLILLYLFMATGYAMIAWGHSYSIVLIGLILVGFGLGLVLPNINLWLNSKTPAAKRGKVLGGLTSCIFLGQFCSPIVVYWIKKMIAPQASYAIAAGLLAAIAIWLISMSLSEKSVFD